MSEDWEVVGESADDSISFAMRKAREEQENTLIRLEAEEYARRSVTSVLKDEICEQTREIAALQQRIAVLENVLGQTLNTMDRLQRMLISHPIYGRLRIDILSALGRVFRDEGLHECSFIPASLKPLMNQHKCK